MNKLKIIFNKSTINFILDSLDYKTDRKGYVINKGGVYVWDVNGQKFKSKDIIGIINNKFITDLTQLISNKLNK